MELTADIHYDLEPLLRRLVREVTSQAPQQISNLQCSDPALGIWIINCDYVFLMDTLNVRDSVFNVRFPELRVPEEHRQEFANNLQAHCDDCEYCAAKRDEDVAWKARVDSAIETDKETILAVVARAAGKR